MSAKKVILLVEDDEASQYIFSTLLQHRGYHVLHILDGKPAQPHPGNPDAVAAGDGLVYPPVQAGLFAGGG